ncbi:MAG: replication-associated recombination protein A, partial [Cobetia sp.]
TTLMKELGMGEGYRYAHNEPNGYPAGRSHDAWPEELPTQQFYRPTQHGGEKRFAEIERWRREQDAAADRGETPGQS